LHLQDADLEHVVRPGPFDPDRAGEEMSRLGAQRAMDVVQLRRHMKGAVGEDLGRPRDGVHRHPIARLDGQDRRQDRIEAAPVAGRDRGRELVLRGRHRIPSRASWAKLRLRGHHARVRRARARLEGLSTMLRSRPSVIARARE
jgi:hypothetical protein